MAPRIPHRLAISGAVCLSIASFAPRAEQPVTHLARPPVAIDITCNGQEVCREALTDLPFRVLPRPFSNIYSGKDDSPGNLVRSNVPAFWPLYVFARDDLDLSNPADPRGWYRVGESVQGPPSGWLKASDALEWHQALVMAYTHPGGGPGRRPAVLMFRNLDDLKQVMNAGVRVPLVAQMREGIEQGRYLEQVVSKEPERFVDIAKTFYLLPIVSWEQVELDGEDLRYLQIAAAVPGARGPDTLDNPEYRTEASREPGAEGPAAQALAIDVVFVMDMTRSMQPYIDRTKQTLVELARRIGEQQVEQRLRFGLVGYRDDVTKIPALEFTTKNFTPELVDLEHFSTLLGEVRAARVNSRDYPEEVFAGVELALQSSWREGALHLLVLVGDASSHTGEQATTQKTPEVLNRAAGEKQIHLIAVHLLDPRMPADQPVAAEQFRVLSRIKGQQDQSALVQVDTADPEQFSASVGKTFDNIAEVLAEAQQGNVTTAQGAAPSEGNSAVEQADAASRAVLQAALVEYLGREAKPPKDILAWVADRDLADPSTPALQVRVLVTKEQLSDLSVALQTVLQAMDRAQLTQQQFLTAVQEVSTQTMKRPEAIARASRLSDSGLLPAFIQSLPYRSDILALDNPRFAALSAQQRADLEASLKAKLAQYRTINEDANAWVRLNPNDPNTQQVHPLPLDYLP